MSPFTHFPHPSPSPLATTNMSSVCIGLGLFCFRFCFQSPQVSELIRYLSLTHITEHSASRTVCCHKGLRSAPRCASCPPRHRWAPRGLGLCQAGLPCRRRLHPHTGAGTQQCQEWCWTTPKPGIRCLTKCQACSGHLLIRLENDDCLL